MNNYHSRNVFFFIISKNCKAKQVLNKKVRILFCKLIHYFPVYHLNKLLVFHSSLQWNTMTFYSYSSAGVLNRTDRILSPTQKGEWRWRCVGLPWACGP